MTITESLVFTVNTEVTEMIRRKYAMQAVICELSTLRSCMSLQIHGPDVYYM